MRLMPQVGKCEKSTSPPKDTSKKKISELIQEGPGCLKSPPNTPAAFSAGSLLRV